LEEDIGVGEGGEYLWSRADCVVCWVCGLQTGRVRRDFSVVQCRHCREEVSGVM
jgi:hypothetical protein